MNLFERLTALFKKSGIEIPAEKFEELKKQLEELKIDGLPEPPSSNSMTPEQFKVYLDAATQKISELTKKVDEESSSRNKILEQIEADKKKQNSLKIKNLLDEAVKAGKLTPEQAKFSENDNEKSLYQKRLEKDFEEWSAEIHAKQGTTPNNPPADGKPDSKSDKSTDLLGGVVNSKYLDYVNSLK